jgi:hypothetical protein
MGVPVVVPSRGITEMGPRLGVRLDNAPFDLAMTKQFIFGCGFERFDSKPEP